MGDMNQEQRMRAETRAIWATVVCFLVGAGAGMLALWGNRDRSPETALSGCRSQQSQG